MCSHRLMFLKFTNTLLCLFQDQPSSNFANWFLIDISAITKVHINMTTTDFNYLKTNMLLSVNPYTSHSWKTFFQAKKPSTHKNAHDVFFINYFCYVELCFHVAFCYIYIYKISLFRNIEQLL